ncbi:MAG: polyamine aminopropyltransferase [Desulfomonile tiedjei]|uniref:Polyamine aminopropyltransferase n=1 Tax=Desulfomonile tiedjei TaxID=2358 RepID=A0A9D6V1N6_9BACT|nr:polyamine aminopropyltransferase [Desulfomonile tiedjei]
MSLNDNSWFTEAYNDFTAFSVRYSRKLYDETSDFQRIEIFETDAMGRVLILNGCFMVTEKDTFIYHEMLVHPAMALLETPRRVVIIGGGDAGAVTELVKYSELESITLCEIDPRVVSSCREYFPALSSGLDDPRVQVLYEDGAAFISRFQEEFDLVLVDSTDPVGPGVALYEMSFYQNIKKSLKKNGAAVLQTESPLFMADVFENSVKNLRSVFGNAGATPYLAVIPSYPGGMWSFTMCSETVDPTKGAPRNISGNLRGDLRYYNGEVHRAAFALPEFVRRML